jgi:CTD small phosphatase-like protein 2
LGRELVKDLSRVGRELSRVLLVDNLEKNFRLQPENGIHVRSWYGDPNDRILEDLGKELCLLAASSPPDLRASPHVRAFL